MTQENPDSHSKNAALRLSQCQEWIAKCDRALEFHTAPDKQEAIRAARRELVALGTDLEKGAQRARDAATGLEEAERRRREALLERNRIQAEADAYINNCAPNVDAAELLRHRDAIHVAAQIVVAFDALCNRLRQGGATAANESPFVKMKLRVSAAEAATKGVHVNLRGFGERDAASAGQAYAVKARRESDLGMALIFEEAELAAAQAKNEELTSDKTATIARFKVDSKRPKVDVERLRHLFDLRFSEGRIQVARAGGAQKLVELVHRAEAALLGDRPTQQHERLGDAPGDDAIAAVRAEMTKSKRKSAQQAEG